MTDPLPVSLIGINSRTLSQYIDIVADCLLVSLSYSKICNLPTHPIS
jgi:ribonucleoside-diphosphate reductase beta chain